MTRACLFLTGRMKTSLFVLVLIDLHRQDSPLVREGERCIEKIIFKNLSLCLVVQSMSEGFSKIFKFGDEADGDGNNNEVS